MGSHPKFVCCWIISDTLTVHRKLLQHDADNPDNSTIAQTDSRSEDRCRSDHLASPQRTQNH